MRGEVARGDRGELAAAAGWGGRAPASDRLLADERGGGARGPGELAAAAGWVEGHRHPTGFWQMRGEVARGDRGELAAAAGWVEGHRHPTGFWQMRGEVARGDRGELAAAAGWGAAWDGAAAWRMWSR